MQEKQLFLKKFNKSIKILKSAFLIQLEKPRSNEVEGVDYFFISKEEFEKKIKDNKFYEYAKIFDNYYGTSKKY